MGFLSIRGEIISLMDSKVILNSVAVSDLETSKIIIFEQEDSHVGIIVDSVYEVITIQEDDIGESPHLHFNDNSSSYVKGVVVKDNKLIIVIDPMKTKLSLNTLEELDEVA